MIHLITILVDYVAFIRDFENSLKEKYSIDVNPYCEVHRLGKVARIGTVGDYNYHYHGSGCSFTYKGIVGEFSICIGRGTEIQFVEWGITQFIETHPKYSEYSIDKDILRAQIKEMVYSDELSMLELGGRWFETYLIL